MKIQLLDLKTLQDVRRYWVEPVSENTSVTEASLELFEQFFDYIEQNQLYGDYSQRSNMNTYIGVDLDEDGLIDVIIEIIYVRRGRVKTFKVMDIYYGPALEALGQVEYDKKSTQMLAYVVNQFINESRGAIGGTTKIYARTDTSLKFLTQLHEASQSLKDEFEAVGLEVGLEGGRWLAFRVKK